MMASGGVISTHHTKTSDREWDGSAQERNVGNDDVTAFRALYAYVDPEKPENKTGAKFPHHEVGKDGEVGPANVKACISGIGILNGGRGGANIDAGERKGIYDHLAAHLRDAGEEPAELEE